MDKETLNALAKQLIILSKTIEEQSTKQLESMSQTSQTLNSVINNTESTIQKEAGSAIRFASVQAFEALEKKVNGLCLDVNTSSSNINSASARVIKQFRLQVMSMIALCGEKLCLKINDTLPKYGKNGEYIIVEP